jgi:hypothetical protein
VSVAYPDGSRTTRTLDGAASLAVSGTTEVQNRVVEELVLDRPGASRIEAHVVSSATSSFLPLPSTDTTTPFARGAVDLAGSLVVTAAGATRTLVRRSDPPVLWTRACRADVPAGSGFDGGTVAVGSDVGQNFAITFAGCIQSTLSFGP